MSKILIVLACLCAYVVIGAVIHPSKTDKAGNLSVTRHIDYQMRLSGNASRVGRQSSGDQLLGYHGYDCNGKALKNTLKFEFVFRWGMVCAMQWGLLRFHRRP